VICATLACQDPQKVFRDRSKISLITIWLLRDFPIFLEILPEVAASCQSGFVAAAGGNLSADANGDITINPGDRSLGVTVHKGNLALTFRAADPWTIRAASVRCEANPTPPLPGFVTMEPEHRLPIRHSVLRVNR
jgi:hypothetical protein